MKKVLTGLLAITFAFSLTGVTFAQFPVTSPASAQLVEGNYGYVENNVTAKAFSGLNNGGIITTGPATVSSNISNTIHYNYNDTGNISQTVKDNTGYAINNATLRAFSGLNDSGCFGQVNTGHSMIGSDISNFINVNESKSGGATIVGQKVESNNGYVKNNVTAKAFSGLNEVGFFGHIDTGNSVIGSDINNVINVNQATSMGFAGQIVKDNNGSAINNVTLKAFSGLNSGLVNTVGYSQANSGIVNLLNSNIVSSATNPQ
jgi:hypothetical protein